MPREIRLNAFEMNCVGHQSPGLWAHPRDRSSQYKDLEYWTDLARLLERGRFDGLFIADVLGIYDVLDGNGDAAIRQAAQVPVNDPLALITPMAAVTRHLGFGLTASLSFEHPYPFARRLSTLDHLTKGRIGWNVVTSYLESGARNLGQQAQLDHDRRYDYADEYLQVLYKLFEGSWEDGAVLRDRRRRIFSDPGKIHEIRHVGEHFQVPGIHLCEPSPQRTPVLYQAGASSRGSASPPSTPSACSSPRHRRPCSSRRSPTSASASPRPAAIRARYWCSTCRRWCWAKPTPRPGPSSTNTAPSSATKAPWR